MGSVARIGSHTAVIDARYKQSLTFHERFDDPFSIRPCNTRALVRQQVRAIGEIQAQMARIRR